MQFYTLSPEVTDLCATNKQLYQSSEDDTNLLWAVDKREMGLHLQWLKPACSY